MQQRLIIKVCIETDSRNSIWHIVHALRKILETNVRVKGICYEGITERGTLHSGSEGDIELKKE